MEDNAPEGGLCEGILNFYANNKIQPNVRGFAVKDEFIKVGTVKEQLKDNGLDAETVTEFMKNEAR